MVNSVIILNGPNLNMLGSREPEIYGSQTLENIHRLCENCAASLSLKADFRQSNHEGQLIDWIHETPGTNVAGLVLNPGALGHTSIALMDALSILKVPVIEVHLSNIHKREEFRQHTYTSRVARGVITGLGSYGYVLAIWGISELWQNAQKSR